MHPLLKLSIFVILISAIRAQDPKEQQFRGCGERLAEMLSFVCKDNFNGKRSDPGLTHVANLHRVYKDEPTGNELSMYPLMMPRKDSFLIKSTRYRRDTGRVYVTEECCMKSCSISEMLGYCAPNN